MKNRSHREILPEASILRLAMERLLRTDIRWLDITLLLGNIGQKRV